MQPLLTTARLGFEFKPFTTEQRSLHEAPTPGAALLQTNCYSLVPAMAGI